MKIASARTPVILSHRRKLIQWLSLGVSALVCLIAGVPVQAQVNPTLSNFVNQALSSSMNWRGGTGTFLLQKKYALTDPAWINVLTTSNRNFTVPREAQSALYRLQSDSTNTVLPYTAFLTATSEVPATASSGIGMAALSLEGSNLTYYVTFSGLTGPATAAHIHAAATTTTSAGVMIGFSPPAATSGTFSGKLTMTADQITNMVNGLCYINIHTPANGGGEIRGQIVPLQITAPMDGGSEVPPVSPAGSARATLTFIGNQLFYEIPYTNLSSGATAAHFHGPTTNGGTAGVLIPLNNPTGTSGVLSGSRTLSQVELGYILSGQTYLNIHTGNNPGGEIRGHVWPLQMRVIMDGPSEVPVVVTPATATGLLTVISNKLSYSFSFTNLSSTATAAHIHGPSSSTNTAGVMIGFSPPAATSGTFSGTATLTSVQLYYLITGQTYVNIHSVNHGGGEIRAQDFPAN
jgi:hypothetical protein